MKYISNRVNSWLNVLTSSNQCTKCSRVFLKLWHPSLHEWIHTNETIKLVKFCDPVAIPRTKARDDLHQSTHGDQSKSKFPFNYSPMSGWVVRDISCFTPLWILIRSRVSPSRVWDSLAVMSFILFKHSWTSSTSAAHQFYTQRAHKWKTIVSMLPLVNQLL
jgi:hypothetical protein